MRRPFHTLTVFYQVLRLAQKQYKPDCRISIIVDTHLSDFKHFVSGKFTNTDNSPSTECTADPTTLRLIRERNVIKFVGMVKSLC